MSANEIKGPSETCDTGAALSGSRLWERLRCPSTKCHSPQLSPPLLTTAETQHSWDSGFQCRAVDSDGARFYLYLSPGRGGAISFHPHTRLLLKKTSGLWAVEFPYRCNVFIKTKKKTKNRCEFRLRSREEISMCSGCFSYQAGAFQPRFLPKYPRCLVGPCVLEG